ncbi:MAG: hypothetical protein J7M21_04665, partial [Planctomycetes bacterium]|nr:hypothetical protein [Planctomycetota bacterium]
MDGQLPTFEICEPRLMMSASVGQEPLLAGGMLDDFANQADQARLLRIYRSGAGAVRGRIDYQGDRDCFQFVAARTGLATVEMFSYGRGNELQASLTALNASGELLAEENLQAGASTAASFRVVAGETYYIEAAGEGGTTGRYYIRKSPTLAAEFADAEQVDLAPTAERLETGSLDAGGRRTYSFTAAANGYVYIDLRAADGSQLDGYLEVYNARQRRIARNDDASRRTKDSHLRLRVRAGQTYYVRASADDETQGDYQLVLTGRPYDDRGDDADAAWAMRLRRNGASAAYGRVNYGGDHDVFQYVAVHDGLVRIQAYTPGRRNTLDGQIDVYDAEHNLLASVGQVDEQGRLNVSFTAQAGESYFLDVTGQADTTGRYFVRVLPTLWQELLDAEQVDLAAAGREVLTGSLDGQSAVAYKFTAAANGYVDIDLCAADGSQLDGYLEVYDTRQRRIARNDDASRQTTDSHIRLRVRAGRTYYVRLTAAGQTGGAYELTLAGRPFDDAGNVLADAAVLRLNGAGAGWTVRNINYAGDTD